MYEFFDCKLMDVEIVGIVYVMYIGGLEII